MDYYTIGQRIRKMRKACHMTQEQLAEAAEISLTHMSHIETGNTKLSLPVLVRIAECLSVRTDELLYDVPKNNKSYVKKEIAEIIDSCSEKDAAVLLEILRASKVALEKHK